MPRVGRTALLFDENGILSKPCRRCGCQITKANVTYSGRGVIAYCRPCNRYMRRHVYRNDADSDKRRNYRLMKEFEMTLEQYNEMLTNQKGVCAICKKKNNNGKNLSVDHDHKTDKIRALLCNNCNAILGLAGDDKQVLADCLSYLIKHTNFEEEFK